MSITFYDKKEAEEYKAELERQGYSASINSKHGGLYKVTVNGESENQTSDNLYDLENENRELERRLENIKKESGGESMTMKVIKNTGRSIGNIAKAMNDPEDKEHKRMKISRMPTRKSMPIASFNINTPITPKNAGIKRRHISYAPKNKI